MARYWLCPLLLVALGCAGAPEGPAVDLQAERSALMKADEALFMGYTIGTYELTVEQDGASMVTVGKYVTLWKKQADGSWKVVVDCFNADGPPTEA